MRGKIIALSAVFILMLTGCASKNEDMLQQPNPETNVTEEQQTDITILIDTRDDPSIEVSAEEFQKEMGYSFSVPQGAQEVTYVIDTEQHRGYMGFYLDGVLWNARVKRADAFTDIVNTYIDDYVEEIGSELDSEQILQVHGADPEIHYYRYKYDNKTLSYDLTAMWYLEKEGFMVALTSYSETPIHTMPVEVFG